MTAPLDVAATPDPADSNTPSPEGWSYALQLMPGVSVCCDAGDHACENRTSDQPIYPASINRSIGVPAQAPGGTTRRLALGLSMLPAPDEALPAGPGAIDKGHAYVVTAGRMVNATAMTSATANSSSGSPDEMTAITCSLNNQGTVVGGAVFQLQRRNSATAGVNNPTDPLLTGAIDLSYWH